MIKRSEYHGDHSPVPEEINEVLVSHISKSATTPVTEMAASETRILENCIVEDLLRIETVNDGASSHEIGIQNIHVLAGQ